MRKRTTAAAATLGAAVLGGSLFVLTQHSADAAYTTSEWNCQKTSANAYPATVGVTLAVTNNYTGSGKSKKLDSVSVTVTPGSAPAGASTAQKTFSGSLALYQTDPFGSTTNPPAAISATATVTSGTTTYTLPITKNGVVTSGFVGFDPADETVYCATSKAF